MAANNPAAQMAAEFKGGELLFCGGTDWAQLGRSGGKQKPKDAREELEREQKYPNLTVPHRLKSLEGVRITYVAGGPTATHCFAADSEGRCYTWGRNEKGQLGHGDLLQRNVPTVVEGLRGKFVVAGSCGKHHTAVVTRDGESYTFGSNLVGQCGTGSIKTRNKIEELILSPVKAMVSGVTQVSCGGDFTVWLCGGQVFCSGSPQYGQIGDGSDHSYNAKDSSIQIMYEPIPTPKLVAALQDKNILRMAAGQQHTIAIDDQGGCYTWGNGGYGRLGHKIQQDEFKPRKVEFFVNRMAVPANAVIGAGGTSTFCSGTGMQMYSWGKLKANGDNFTSPYAISDLSGWNVRSLACGPAIFAVAADMSVITWGGATNGELGYGAGKKSSANPAKCDSLDNTYTHQVAAGSGFTLFLCDPEAPKVKAAPVFDSQVVEVAPAGGEEEGAAGSKGRGRGGKAAAGGKRKAETAGAGRGKKAK